MKTQTPAGPRVVASPAALGAIALLVAERGAVMFVQSGGCCDGSAPMCFLDGEFLIGDHDILLGKVAGCPVYIDERLARVWEGSRLILDVEPGDPEGFSLPAGDGSHFVSRAEPMDLGPCSGD